MGGLGYLDCGTLYNVKFTKKKTVTVSVLQACINVFAGTCVAQLQNTMY